MSSKTVGQQQQQGRRTPLSLAGSKSSHHQSHNNKSNQNSYINLAKNQEPKDLLRQNGNNNHPKESNASQQKDTKKTQQQNANKHNNNGTNSEQVQKSNGNHNAVVTEEHGSSNGNSNGVTIKNDAGKSTAQPSVKENKEKEKLKDKEKEMVSDAVKEKPKKSDASKGTSPKVQNESQANITEQAPPSANSNNLKDAPINASDTTLNTSADRKQNANSSSGKSKINNADSKVITPSKSADKGTATPPSKSSPVMQKSKVSTPAKSPVKNAPSDVDQVHMEVLSFDKSPGKKLKESLPAATSTPGKILTNAKSDVADGSPDHNSVPRTFSQISGRRAIRNSGDYIPSMYNTQFRESYRRINTELDVTSNTNTSMNVTVGSEVPNNSSFLSFSIFGRGRKRERTPPPSTLEKSQSGAEATLETTPPKRARLDIHGIFTAMSSPLTLLRSRFSKATIEGSPTKEQQEQDNNSDAGDVQNVSGVSIEEVAENTATGDVTIGKEATTADNTPTKSTDTVDKPTEESVKLLQNGDDGKNPAAGNMDVDSDIEITETPIIAAVGEPKGKQRGCLLM